MTLTLEARDQQLNTLGEIGLILTWRFKPMPEHYESLHFITSVDGDVDL
jgi:hypothetical protein